MRVWLRASTRLLRAAIACTVMAACGGGDGGTTPNVTPVVTVSSGNGASTISSGASVQLTVRVTNNRGTVVSNPSVTWSSSNASVATVSTTGSVTGALTGTATISAAAEGVTGTFAVTVTPGAPSRLAIRRQPGGAAVSAAFSTQPVIDLLDAAGNVVTSATNFVTVALASGGGTLLGTTSVTPVSGSASFVDLSLLGTIGNRTLTFTAAGMTSVTSDPFALSPGAAAKLAMRTQPAGAASGAPLLTQPVIEVRDVSENLVSTAAPTTVTATVLSGGGTLSGATAVSAAGVATFSALAVSGIVGARTLQFSAPGLTPVTSASVDLVAGAPATLTLQTAPAGGGLNSVFTTPAVLAVRDNGGNLATGSSTTVTASIATGGGTLSGASANTVNGIATFTALSIAGAAGARTLSFSAVGVPSLSVPVSPCNAIVAPQLSVAALSGSLIGFFQRTAVSDTVAIRDLNGSCTSIGTVTTSIAYTGGGSWLSAVPVSASSRLAVTATPGALAVGTYSAVVTVTSATAGSAQLPVTFEVRPSATLAYGAADQKVTQLDPTGTLRIVPVVTNQTGVVNNPPLQFISRSPTIATVAADGTITGRVGGQAWIVATTTHDGGASDSIFLNVTRTTGPLLRLDVTRFAYTRNTDFSVTVYLDLRGQTVGAANAVFNWPTVNGTPGLLRLNNTVPGATGAPVIVSDAISGTTRISIASATGLTGLINLGRFDFTPQFVGNSQFVLRINELIGLDQSSLLENANALQYPVIVR